MNRRRSSIASHPLPWMLVVLSAALAVLFGTAVIEGDHPIYRDAGHWYAPVWKWAQQNWGQGTVPLWDPFQNLGESHVADGTTSVFYPGKLIFALPLEFSTSYTLFLLGHVLLAAATMFLFARRWVSPAAAVFAATSYAFSGSVFYQIYNAPFLIGAAWLPLALAAGWDMRLGKAQRRSVIGLGVAIAMMLLGGDAQMVYHVALLLILMGFFVDRHPDRRQGWVWSRLVLLGFLCGIGLSAVQTIPSARQVAQSERAVSLAPRTVWELLRSGSLAERDQLDPTALLARTKQGTHHDRVFQFSVGPWRWAELIWPNVFGRVVPKNSRWITAYSAEGRTWTPSLYIGLLPLLAAGSALFGIRRSPAPFRWAATFSVFGAIAAMGVYGLGWLVASWNPVDANHSETMFGHAFGGLYWLMTVLLPGYVQFRYPAKWWVVVSCGLALLAGAGFDATMAKDTPRRFRMMVSLAGVSLVGLVVNVMCGSAWQARLCEGHADSVFGPLLASAACRSVQVGLLQTLMVCGIGCSVVWVSRWERLSRWISPQSFIPTFWVLLTVIDLTFAQNQHVIVGRIPPVAITERGELGSSPAETQPRRIYRSPEQNRRPVVWRARSSGDRMQQVVDWDVQTISPQHQHARRIAVANCRTSIASWDWQQILQIAEDDAEPPMPPDGFQQLICGPRAWLVDDVQFVKPLVGSPIDGRRERLREIWFPQGRLRDFHASAIVESDKAVGEREGLASRQPSPISGSPLRPLDSNRHATCSITDYSANRVSIDVQTPHRALLVLADRAAPGWTAVCRNLQDLSEAPLHIYRANGVMRSVVIPPGQHRVTMTYRPRDVGLGAGISGITLVGLLVAVRRRRDACESDGTSQI